jgi:hypothetical protein
MPGDARAPRSLPLLLLMIFAVLNVGCRGGLVMGETYRAREY